MGYVSLRLLVLGLFFTSVANFSGRSFAGEVLGTEPLAAAGFKSLQRGIRRPWRKRSRLV